MYCTKADTFRYRLSHQGYQVIWANDFSQSAHRKGPPNKNPYARSPGNNKIIIWLFFIFLDLFECYVYFITVFSPHIDLIFYIMF